tara:strand:- start:1082 stop:2338 length:1257 start_codon:yes stop_codon:yes gene_type:complete
MNKKKCKINIIGAGISGLTAAKVLEEKGYSPVIIESGSNVGGRLKTEKVEGHQIDIGFQVLLTAYPAAKKYLNYKDLRLQKLMSGALIYKNKKQIKFGNPITNPSLLFSTLFSKIGTFSDKIKILYLYLRLRIKSNEAIFNSKEINTNIYLKKIGFSDHIISDFFKPFFGGVFLETDLKTSSRMFEFVFKMFSQGSAAIPEKGMQAIPEQMAKSLKKTTFKFNTKVVKVKEKEIFLANKTKIKSDYTIITTDLTGKTKWRSCVNLYFETEDKHTSEALIGLITNKHSIVNNLFFPSSITSNRISKKELLSVTIIDDKNHINPSLIEQVKKELKEECNISVGKLIKQYRIPMALPVLKTLSHRKTLQEAQLSRRVFVAGDITLNGSLNAAIISGETAALKLAKEEGENNLKEEIIHPNN